MEKDKSKNNMILIIIIVILLIIVLALCGYIFLNKTKSSSTKPILENNSSTNVNSESNQKDDSNENIQKDDATNSNGTETKTTSAITFNNSKAINSSEKNYTLVCQGSSGIWITVDSTRKSLTFRFTPANVVEYYGLDWKSNRNDMISSKINFNKKIADVYFGGMGQDQQGDTLFILLEDGTVEYIPIVHMFNHVQAEVVSYGEIKGVSGVAKISTASTPEGVTTLAIKSDGSFYDLWYSLRDTGNY